MIRTHAMAAGASIMLAATSAMAGYTITQSSVPTVHTGALLTFDEVGGPTGNVGVGDWAASHGVSLLEAGDGVPQVGLHDAVHGGGGGWLGAGNSFFGNFGVFMTLETDVTEMAMQVWDPSGPPSPIGGGLGIFLFNDGVEVGSGSYTPAWGGGGQEWFNITTDAGSVFDEVRILGFSFTPTTFVDTISWNPVPAPATTAMIGLAGICAARRRR